MGKNNKTRRAAKAKQRRRRSAAGHRQHQFTDGSSPPTATDLAAAAVIAERRGDRIVRDGLIRHLAELPRSTVAIEIQAGLERYFPQLWESGWQPADLGQVARRSLGDLEVELLGCVLAADAARYAERGHSVAPEWMAQLDGAAQWWDLDRPWLLQLDSRWPETLLAGVRLLAVLGSLPPLPRLVPPPGEWSGLSPMGTHLPAAILAKIRALLAKAESTSFDAEAEALTAKAQELMTRHRIDRAVADRQIANDEVVGRRIWIDNPYPEAKSALLAGIATANGCRAVWTKNIGFATVFGFADELDGIEELFTSLLVQATAALRREGSKLDHHGRSRTTRFRRSFLVAFAERISQRLRSAADRTVRVAENELGGTLVPVLASRAARADEAVDKAFSELEQFSVSATDWEGYSSGFAFGNRADIGTDVVPHELATLTRR